GGWWCSRPPCWGSPDSPSHLEFSRPISEVRLRGAGPGCVRIWIMGKGTRAGPLAAAVVVCVVAGIVLPMLWHHSLVDLKVYRLSGSTLLHNPSELYDVQLAGTVLPFTYPPFAAILMV